MQNSPKILLLHPYNPLEGYHYAVPQVALGYLSSALKGAGFSDVQIVDAHLYRWGLKEVREEIIRRQPDVIGIRVWSHQVGIVDRYLDAFKEALPKVKIIVGGPHPTMVPEFIQSRQKIDFAVGGEAEESVVEILRYIQGDRLDTAGIPGLIERVGENELRKNPLARNSKLDQYGVDWEALQLRDYHRLNQRTTAYDHGRKKNGFIFTTRGCPYPCTYCAAGATNGKKIRATSAARAIADIRFLYEKYGVRHFNIMDDNFTFYREHVLEFCQEFLRIRHEIPGISFHNPNGVRVDRLDDEMLSLMRECNWRWLHIGIESASPQTLKRMRKRLDIELVEKNIAMIRRHGIRVWGFFILGFLDETSSDLEETINFAVRSKLTAASFSLFSPIPGTDVYRELVDAGKIPADYMLSGYFSQKEISFAKNISPSELQEWQRSALRRFYRRPDRAFHLLRDMSVKTFLDRTRTLFTTSPKTKEASLLVES